MSDIFISYASADRSRVKLLVDALVERGWSVWWDRTIPPGKQFDEVIEEALSLAKCVVVLWSQASIGSTWVKTEAAEAMQRKILVPALVDDVKIPLEFRRLQAADLSAWQGDRSHAELKKLLQSIDACVGGEGKDDTAGRERDAGVPRAIPAEPPKAPFASTGPARTGGVTSVDKTRILLWAIALIAVFAGYGIYREQGKRVELETRMVAQNAAQAEQQRAAQEVAAREAAQRKAEEESRQKSETIAPPKAVQEIKPRVSRPRIAAAENASERAAKPLQGTQSVPEALIDVSGLWRDATGTMYQVRQVGSRLEFVATNQGTGYYAQGSGTISGQQVTTRFQTNLPSTGYATWTVGAGGQTFNGTVSDSRLGQYALTVYR